MIEYFGWAMGVSGWVGLGSATWGSVGGVGWEATRGGVLEAYTGDRAWNFAKGNRL